MAQQQTRKRTSANKNTKTRAKSTATKSRSSKTSSKQPVKKNNPFHDEIILVVTLVISLLLILSYFNFSGKVSGWVNGFVFGMMGFVALLFPFVLFFGVSFYLSNRNNQIARRKIISIICLVVVICGFLQLLSYPEYLLKDSVKAYEICAKSKIGGGIIGNLISGSLIAMFGKLGAYIILIGIMLILFMLITERMIFSELRKHRKERKERMVYEEEEHVHEEEKENFQYATPKRQAKTFTFQKGAKESEATASVEEVPAGFVEKEVKKKSSRKSKRLFDQEVKEEIQEDAGLDFTIQRAVPSQASTQMPEVENIYEQELRNKFKSHEEEESVVEAVPIERERPFSSIEMEELPEDTDRNPSSKVKEIDAIPQEPVIDELYHTHKKSHNQATNEPVEELVIEVEPPIKEYVFPPVNLLSKPKVTGKGQSDKELKETAMKLQSTLESFGVRVTITNVSCGPAVTRYELQPEQGVKVSRITNLADDIKLNLAAADVRIEAPIPGKAAVGIEVPNKVNSMVSFRELIENPEFNNHPSDIAFAVGKDIGGQTVVTDIAKMPHLLIAGATGSGKSVCINTLIMSILYKAKPEDVKLIMIDPKVVELSVYNGIPHLLIPVVTDPKKASSALNWAVAEMTDRYKKFADLGVRDIKGYNQKIETIPDNQDVKYQKLPQIVIIVDELADLMMVAPGEVEDAICRLAQMARAAGLHLIIATQRPSVNVITGLIKANVPSRIAFSVSSAIDSRTILDGAGAEKLLGKGDMLFFPSGYPKPVRIQGAFISDKEVSTVVEFLAEQNTGHNYNNDLEGKITSSTSVEGSGGKANELDEYFVDAGKFIIEKDKASIGMIQRVFKVGFNRAARIMEQLHEAGVVGAEEGTKPRKVLMSIDEFEQYIDEYV